VIDCYYYMRATLAETLVISLRIVIDPPRPPPFTYPLWFVDDRTTSGAATLMLGFWQQIGPNSIRNWLLHEYSTSRLQDSMLILNHFPSAMSLTYSSFLYTFNTHIILQPCLAFQEKSLRFARPRHLRTGRPILPNPSSSVPNARL
jgi:hypothetical protein